MNDTEAFPRRPCVEPSPDTPARHYRLVGMLAEVRVGWRWHAASQPGTSASSVNVWRRLVLAGDAVGEEGEPADHHESVEHQWADRGRQAGVLPGDE